MTNPNPNPNPTDPTEEPTMTTTTTGPWVEHTGDDTLAHDTDKDDTAMRAALKAVGFRWGRSIAAWYLPRPWTFARRSASVRQLVVRLEAEGRTIEVQEQRERARSSAEIEAERVERAEARADRMADRAAASEGQAQTLYDEAGEMADAIPFGQPILVGHHSEGRDRRYRERIARKMDKSVETARKADHYAQRARSAEYEARKNENPRLIARRLQRLEADRRRIDRHIWDAWAKPAEGDYRARLKAEAADLDEQIEFQRQLLAQAQAENGRLWEPGDFRKGDQVRVHSRWYPVKRVNRKTVTVPPLLDQGEDTGRSWTDTVPYDEIRGRRRDGITHLRPPDDHPARPDDEPEPGDRCKDCTGPITWTGPGMNDWDHIDS